MSPDKLIERSYHFSANSFILSKLSTMWFNLVIDKMFHSYRNIYSVANQKPPTLIASGGGLNECNKLTLCFIPLDHFSKMVINP